jgi:hypothetical protein
MVLGLAARFPGALAKLGLHKPKRMKTTFDQFMQALAEKPGPRPLTHQEITTLFPPLSQIVGTVVPLCSLTGTDVLRSQSVDPLLAALAALGP